MEDNPVVLTCPANVATAVPAVLDVAPSAKLAPAENEMGEVYEELAEEVDKFRFAACAPEVLQPVIVFTAALLVVPKLVE